MKVPVTIKAVFDGQPLFTVVSLCYNHAPFLHDYFHGLLTQTYPNIQLILHDDCSTDNSWEIIKSYEHELRETFAYVTIERSETNRGGSAAIVHAADPTRLRGKYFSIIETDDYYFPTRIEQVVKFFEANPSIGVVHSSVLFYYQETSSSEEVFRNRENVTGWVFEKLLFGNFIVQCTMAFRCSVFKQYINLNDNLDHGYLMGDYPISLELSRHTEFGYIDDLLACYRIRNGSASRPLSIQKQFDFEKSYYQIQRDFAEKYSVPEPLQFIIDRRYHYLLFRSGYEMGMKDLCIEGYRWLMLNDKGRKFLDRIRALSIRNQYMWRVIIIIDNYNILNKLRLCSRFYLRTSIK